MGTRTGTQVRSHAQKHYMKCKEILNKREEEKKVKDKEEYIIENEVNVGIKDKEYKAPMYSLIKEKV